MSWKRSSSLRVTEMEWLYLKLYLTPDWIFFNSYWIIEWFVLERTKKPSSSNHPPWAGTLSTGACGTWPWTLQGWGEPCRCVVALLYETALRSAVNEAKVCFPYYFVSFFLFKTAHCWYLLKGIIKKLRTSKSQTELDLKPHSPVLPLPSVCLY